MLVGVLGPRQVFQHRRSTVGFAAAPLLILMFGLQAVNRLGRRLGRRGLPLVGLYLVVLVALLVALID